MEVKLNPYEQKLADDLEEIYRKRERRAFWWGLVKISIQGVLLLGVVLVTPKLLTWAHFVGLIE